MALSPPVLYVAIPAIDELDFLPKTLQAIENQDCSYRFEVYICVNQPDTWWNIEEKRAICNRNMTLFAWLNSYKKMKINIIDRFSKGNGWSEKKGGVGWARKVLFDTILEKCQPQDVIVSLDADTLFSPHYFQSLFDRFSTDSDLNAIAVPYYHPLSGDDAADKAMLRYEIYMRNWSLNMQRIGSPYAFTALGSAIAVRASALKKIGGITPLRSGEDFYLLQKLRKMTPIATAHPECVYPATRFSTRVDFGTGPAILKGATGNWDSYPIYHYALFDEIEGSYRGIEELFYLLGGEGGRQKAEGRTQNAEGGTQKAEGGRQNAEGGTQSAERRTQKAERGKNFKTLPLFERAFHNHADGLRISQYLKERQRQLQIPDRQSLIDNMQLLFHYVPDYLLDENFNLTLEQWSEIREIFYKNKK